MLVSPRAAGLLVPISRSTSRWTWRSVTQVATPDGDGHWLEAAG